MAQITLDGVSRTFEDGTEAVKDVDLAIDDGEFMILVGPSGCGKSTLLRMIVGLEDVTEGSVRIDDQDITNKAPRDRNLAMVFQNYALYPHLTVRQNMEFPLKLKKMDKAEMKERVDKAASAARARRAARPEARAALGRAAPAGRDGPGAGAGAGCVPDGRAAVEPRRQAAGADAGRDRRPAATGCTPPPSTSPTTRPRR